MGFAKSIMEKLFNEHPITLCQHCKSLTYLIMVFRGVYICPECERFNSPGDHYHGA